MNCKNPYCSECNDLKKQIKKLRKKLILHRQTKHDEGFLR